MRHTNNEKRKTIHDGRNGTMEMEEKILNEYLKRTRNFLETKLSSRNLIKRINIRAVPLVKYSGLFLKWMREELKQMDLRTRKLMTMHKVLHLRLDVSRKEGGRGPANVDASLQWPEEYLKNGRGRLITATRNNTNDTRINRTIITRKQKKRKKNNFELGIDHLILVRRLDLEIINKKKLSYSGFNRPRKHRKKNQRKQKERQVFRSCHRSKKAVKYEGDSDTNHHWRAWNSPKRLGKGTGRVGNR